MSYSISTFVNCPTMQAKLNDKFQACDYSKRGKMSEKSLVSLLHSPANTNNVLSNMVSPGGGKRRTVELVYTPRLSTTEVGTSIDYDNCTATTKHGQNSETFEIDPNVGVYIQRIVDLADLMDICEANETYIQEMMLDMMDALERKMDVLYAAQLAALKGTFGQNETGTSENNTLKTIATRKSDDTFLNTALSDIDFAADNAGYCGIPLVIGYGEIYQYFKKVQAGCCADEGLNIALLNQIMQTTFLANRNIGGALGSATNSFLTYDLGSVQALNYLRYQGARGVNVVDTESYKQMVVVSPETGIAFDFRMTNDCGKLHFFMSRAVKLVGLPDDVNVVDDPFYGTKGVNEWLISNP